MPATAAPEAAAVRRLVVDRLVVDRRDGDGRRFRSLDVDRLELAPGTILGLAGPSGAGKTTLLDSIAGLVRPDAGRVLWGDDAVSAWPEPRRDLWRRRTVGFVFQDFHLVPELSVADNILLPFRFDRWRLPADARARALALAAGMGLADPGRRAGVLSRGEQQRVAIARCLAARPALILADEPTASLDAAAGAAVADLLVGAARAGGATLVVVTHDPALLARLDRVAHMAAGRLTEAAP